MEKVLGLGGLFFRARDPMGLARWYQNNLGLSVYPATDEPWQQEVGPTVFALGRADQQSMVNFRVRDLDAMLAQLKAGGAAVDDKVMEESYGRFGWVTDPEGNRIELWQPLP